MKREFAVKMIRAKKLEYEALKEILPEKVVNRMDKMEAEMIDIVKQCVMTGFSDHAAGKRESNEPGGKKTKKVNIE